MLNQDEFSLEEGKMLIKFTRENIEFYLKNNKRMPIPDNIKEYAAWKLLT